MAFYVTVVCSKTQTSAEAQDLGRAAHGVRAPIQRICFKLSRLTCVNVAPKLP